MVMTDPIADMLTRIRNGNQMRHEVVEMPGSKMKLRVLEVMKNEGFIKDVEFVSDDKQGTIKVHLKYSNTHERVIKGLKRISKPGLRVYATHNDIPKVLNGLGVAILSTSKGVLTGKDAKHQQIGGEVLAYIW
ncbi:30S ribosomal protein S8 [Mycoplasmatota bacterium]|nr:30S ribosomal protein S8 [Mycoplasmatota bacterium]